MEPKKEKMIWKDKIYKLDDHGYFCHETQERVSFSMAMSLEKAGQASFPEETIVTVTSDGYTGEAVYDPYHDVYTGHVLGIRDVITFSSKNVGELVGEMMASIKEHKVFLGEIEGKK